MTIYIIRELLPSYKDCNNLSEWRQKWDKSKQIYKTNHRIKYFIEKLLLIFSLILVFSPFILSTTNINTYYLITFSIFGLILGIIIGNYHLKSVDQTYFEIKKSAQQVDAPEPATMISSALQTPHRPAR